MAARKVDLFDAKHKYESPTGIAALFSCQPGQFSYYYPDEKATKGRQRSLFFHHLIEGWQGKYSIVVGCIQRELCSRRILHHRYGRQYS